MSLLGWVCKAAACAAAVVAAPVVAPAALAAAGAAAATAGAAAATAATAVGSAAAAAGTMAAGAAATVGGAAAAAGTTVAGVAAAAGTKAAIVTGAKVAAGVAGTALGYGYFESKLDEAEANGRGQGYKHGFKEGKIKAAKDLQVLLEQNENLLLGMFATSLYVARLDGEDETELEYIANCLGNEQLRSEAVKHEIQAIYEKKYNFHHIKTKYLDKVSKEELKYVDDVISGVMNADGNISSNEKEFYEKVWKPYLYNFA